MRRIFSSKEKNKKTRKEIEDEAYAQMRKAKAIIDPGVLAKVRNAIRNSPMAAQLMGNVYAQEEGAEETRAISPKDVVKEEQEKTVISSSVEESQKIGRSLETAEKKKTALQAAKQAHANVKEVEVETVDQGKMIDIVAKMLEMNPHNQSLKKGIKEILKDR